MADARVGTLYVGWQLRLPARFWGATYAKETYGDAAATTEWLVVVKNHRPKSKKWCEEWQFEFTDGETYTFNRRWCNTFLKEERLSGTS